MRELDSTRVTLPGPSRTIIVEPVEVPAPAKRPAEPAPAPERPDREEVPTKEPKRRPREPVPG